MTVRIKSAACGFARVIEGARMNWLAILAEDQGGAPAIMQFVPILIFFVVMMIFMGRSSRRQRQEQEARLAALKKNDKVVTSFGMLGTVVAILDNEVTLK